MKLKVLLFLLVFPVFAAFGQERIPITKADIHRTITRFAELVDSNYIIEDKAKELKSALLEGLKKGEFDKLADTWDFSEKMNELIKKITNDGHFRFVDRPYIPEEENEAEFIAFMKSNNFAFEKMEILPNNVGYLKLNGFVPAEYGRATASAAMNFLAHSKTIIFDLRENGGGSPDMIAYILGYLFKDSTLINTFYNRQLNEYSQSWSVQDVPGLKNLDADIYVLTAKRSFSGAEEFAYDIQTQKRGLVVGEVTGGGAHPVQRYAINEFFSAGIPFMKAINPITKKNWEGTGVTPDLLINADKALTEAYEHAIEKRMASAKDDSEKRMLHWNMELFLAKQNPVKLQPEELQKFAGTYGDRKITVEDGKLFSQRGNGRKYKLYAIKDNYFEITSFSRIRFISDDAKKVTSVELWYDGKLDSVTPKDN